MMRSREGKLLRRAKALLIVASLLAACTAAGPGSAAQAQEPGPSPRFPILLANGAVYPWDYDPGGLPPSFRIDGYREAGLYLVQCKGSVEESWLGELREAGGKVRGYLAYNTLLVAMDGEARAQTGGLPFVSWTGIYQPYFKISPALQLRLTQGGEATVVALLYDGALLDGTAQELREMGVEVLAGETDAWCGLLALRLSPDMVDEVAALPAVEWLELCSGGTLAGAPTPSARGAAGRGCPGGFAAAPTGAPCRVALADSGLAAGSVEDLPQALEGRVASLFSFRGDEGADACGHGTAVAGALLAGASPSGNAGDARYPLEIAVYATGYGVTPLPRPLSMASLLGKAYGEGARVILNGSVPEGRESLGEYGIFCMQRDAFAWDHPDMTIVEPAGNEGSDADGDGVVDRGNLLGGAAAKNVLAVGGSEGPRAAGIAYEVPAYGELEGIFPGRFSASPLKEDKAEGSLSGMAAFSSRGPTTDGRVKPDLVAAATGVATCASPAAQGSPAMISRDGEAAVLYGTSVAAALVAGRIATLRSELAAARGAAPSAALVKAFLLNGAMDLYPGQYGEGSLEVPRAPNPVEGWGRCDFAAPAERETWLRVVDDTEGLRSGESRVFRVEVGSGEQLRVTLAWSDYPSLPEARLHLVNDLDLRVIDPDGAFSYPNGRTSRDPLNNVERVVLEISGKPGTYTLEIAAPNVPMAPQPYALVVQLF